MEKPTYKELQTQFKEFKEEKDRLMKENSSLQAKLYEMQFMIKKYIMQD